MSENAPEPEVIDPATALQNTLSEIGGDSLCVGYVCVVEWVEPNGSSSVEVFHTDMTPWHLHGLMDYGQALTQLSFEVPVDIYDEDDD